MLDTTFNTGGSGFDNFVQFYDIDIQSDDKIIVGGVFSTYNGNPNLHIVRLNADGSFDSSFITGNGFDGSFTNGVVIQPLDGKIVVTGQFQHYNDVSCNNITRLNSNGTIDSTFANNIGSGFNDITFDSALQTDGKIVIGGNFTDFSGNLCNYIAHLTILLTADAADLQEVHFFFLQ